MTYPRKDYSFLSFFLLIKGYHLDTSLMTLGFLNWIQPCGSLINAIWLNLIVFKKYNNNFIVLIGTIMWLNLIREAK